MSRIRQEEEEEAPMGRTVGAPSDRVVAPIAADEGDAGGCLVYGVDKG